MYLECFRCIGILYISAGPTEPCCTLAVLPHPTTVPNGPRLQAATCNGEFIPVNGGVGYFNGNAGCACAIPVSSSTWGRVKSLYVE